MANVKEGALSRYLAYILRHHPESIGLYVDEHGWAYINHVLELSEGRGHNTTRKHIDDLVQRDKKGRFSISPCGRKIRANQGHTVEGVDIPFEVVEPPQRLYHGTAERFVEAIIHEGLKRMERHYVHLTDDPRQAIESGSRYGKPIVFEIPALRMNTAGVKFYRSPNGVWLVERVEAFWLTKRMSERDVELVSGKYSQVLAPLPA